MPWSELIHVGIAGTALALNSATGVQGWAVRLMGPSFVSVASRSGTSAGTAAAGSSS